MSTDSTPPTSIKPMNAGASARYSTPLANSGATEGISSLPLRANPSAVKPFSTLPAANSDPIRVAAPASRMAGSLGPNGTANSLASLKMGVLTGDSTAGATSLTAVTTPTMSPIATVLALPAKLVDVALSLFGITTPQAGSTPTPISPAPLFQLAWAIFRRFETLAGLDAPLVNQPVLPKQIFTGSLTTPTPTVSEFLNAAAAGYVLGGDPGLTPLIDNGVPVSYANVLTGTAAQAWVTPQNQIIIAYEGTTGGTHLLFNPLMAVSMFAGDLIGLTPATPPTFTDALSFARHVEAVAAQQGYAPDSIFLTGHSLGGWEAEYVAQQTGWGGIGFESGPLHTTVPGNGADSLFVNTCTYGDPAGYFASDLAGLQPFSPPYVAGGGAAPHYGSIALLGDPNAQVPLTNAASLLGPNIFGDVIFLAVFAAQLLEFHMPGVQAYLLDVNLKADLLPGAFSHEGAVNTGYGDLTIPQFLAAESASGNLVTP
jgi:hypothetical protein